MSRLAALTLPLLLLAAPLAAQGDLADVSLPDPAQEAQALQLMDEIRCVVCQGQPISGSNAGLAGDMRRVIRERIAAGETPDQVRTWLVRRYGDWVSFEPLPSTRTAPLWAVPLLALLAGTWLVMRRLQRKRRNPS